MADEPTPQPPAPPAPPEIEKGGTVIMPTDQLPNARRPQGSKNDDATEKLPDSHEEAEIQPITVVRPLIRPPESVPGQRAPSAYPPAGDSTPHSAIAEKA